ncbi:MAG: arylamine N-acetyltransferase [Bacteroidota bacterium]
MRLNYFQNRPKASKIDVDAYLARIHQSKEPASLKYLRKLHRSHQIQIPFENLDIHYGQKIVLDYQKIFEKLITNRRGGFCYELNGLFYHLLSHVGFDCFLISAKVKNKETQEFGRDYDHMAIVVRIDGEEWLVDVGFGEGMIYPKKIIKGLVQMDYVDYWRMDTDPDENLILQVSLDSNHFRSLYLFTLQEKQVIQFMEMCEYQQSSPQSTFTQKKLITKLTAEGRITLTDRKLKILALGEVSEVDIMNEDEFISKLEQHFGISFRQLIPKRQ